RLRGPLGRPRGGRAVCGRTSAVPQPGRPDPSRSSPAAYDEGGRGGGGGCEQSGDRQEVGAGCAAPPEPCEGDRYEQPQRELPGPGPSAEEPLPPEEAGGAVEPAGPAPLE